MSNLIKIQAYETNVNYKKIYVCDCMTANVCKCLPCDINDYSPSLTPFQWRVLSEKEQENKTP